MIAVILTAVLVALAISALIAVRMFRYERRPQGRRPRRSRQHYAPRIEPAAYERLVQDHATPVN